MSVLAATAVVCLPERSAESLHSSLLQVDVHPPGLSEISSSTTEMQPPQLPKEQLGQFIFTKFNDFFLFFVPALVQHVS